MNLPTSFSIGELKIRVLVDAETSKGNFEMFEFSSEKPGQGPGLHLHREMEEFFYLISGQVEFTIGGEKRIASKGYQVTIPRGTVHGWQTRGDEPFKMLILFSPSKLQQLYYSELEKKFGEGLSWDAAIRDLSRYTDNIPS